MKRALFTEYVEDGLTTRYKYNGDSSKSAKSSHKIWALKGEKCWGF